MQNASVTKLSTNKGRLRAPGAHSALLSILFLTLLTPACSVRRIALNKVGDALSSSGTAFASDDDPILVRDAAPFSLKLMESILAEAPRHRNLLLAASRGFTQYAYAFIQQEAEEREEGDLEAADALRERARRMYLRARDYGLRALERRRPGLAQRLQTDPKSAASSISSVADVPLLYWTAAAWGSAIAIAKTPELVADQPAVEALIDRALKLDESFEAGAIHGFLISYEPSRQGASGDALARARVHFERALALTHGQLASPYVAYAEAVSVPKQDRLQFQELLNKALVIDLSAKPEWRLENSVMQKRARWLIKRIDQLFVEGGIEK